MEKHSWSEKIGSKIDKKLYKTAVGLSLFAVLGAACAGNTVEAGSVAALNASNSPNSVEVGGSAELSAAFTANALGFCFKLLENEVIMSDTHYSDRLFEDIDGVLGCAEDVASKGVPDTLNQAISFWRRMHLRKHTPYNPDKVAHGHKTAETIAEFAADSFKPVASLEE
jgi:hypothetical protein